MVKHQSFIIFPGFTEDLRILRPDPAGRGELAWKLSFFGNSPKIARWTVDTMWKTGCLGKHMGSELGELVIESRNMESEPWKTGDMLLSGLFVGG